MFHHLNTTNTGYLTCDEYENIYDSITLQWEAQFSNIPWYHTAWQPIQALCNVANKIIMWPHFETGICECIVLD